MGDFWNFDVDYSSTTLEEGWKMFLEREGIVRSIGYGYCCRGTITPGSHWSGRWIDTRGMGNHGTHIIIPKSPEARELVREYFVTIWWQRHGVTLAQARAIYDYRMGYKHEQIDLICRGVLDTAAHRAFRDFPGVGPGLHLMWAAKWGNVVRPYTTKSWPRNQALIAVVNAAIK